MKQSSKKSQLVAIGIWVCVCYTIYTFGVPIVGETVMALLGLGGVFLLFPLLTMCAKFFDDEE